MSFYGGNSTPINYFHTSNLSSRLHIVFPGFIYMPGWITLGEGSPCWLGGVTALDRLTFYHVKSQGRATLLRGLPKFSTIRLLSHSRHL